MSVADAVEQRDKGPMAQIELYRPDFAIVLPSHVGSDHYVRMAQGLLRRNPQLKAVAEKNVGSFLAALLDCARLGGEPGETYHLVPFGNEVVGIEDYKLLIELIYNAGRVNSVKAEIVYEKDEYVFDRETMDRPRHNPPKPFATKDQRGAMIGAYAYCDMKGGGTSRVVEMAEWEIMEHRAVSKTASRTDSMWNKWPRSAWLKTVVRELFKWVPSSTEIMTIGIKAERAGMADEPPRAGLSAAAADLPPVSTDYIDGEVVEPDVDGGESSGWPEVTKPGLKK